MSRVTSFLVNSVGAVLPMPWLLIIDRLSTVTGLTLKSLDGDREVLGGHFWEGQYCNGNIYYTPCTTKLLGWWGVYWFQSIRPSVSPACPGCIVVPTVLIGSISYHTSYHTTSESVSRVKFLAKFKNLNFWQFFKICNFDIILFWTEIWCESLVWVIMEPWRVSQNAGILVLVSFWFCILIIIPMYKLWLNGLYGLYGPRCPLSSKRPINLISLSLSW